MADEYFLIKKDLKLSTFFPLKPAYPKNYDSDRTLYLVFNTSETLTTEANNPWADEISIKPVDQDKNEIWADNGFANIEGELFYYDSVEKNEYGKINKLKRCSRNIGGTHTKHNKSGSEVRGFVIAEHHNQIADAILQIESFVGENFSEDQKTLDWRIRHLQALPVIFDDFTCPNISFSFYIVEDNPATGILAQYEIVIDGSFSSFKLDFGDGEFTNTATKGTHRYATNSIIDPVVTVTNSKCSMIQTPTTRKIATEPQNNPTTTPFEIPIPTIPNFPSFNIPTIPTPSTIVQPPPIVFPCLEVAPFPGINIPSIIFPDINIPSIIVFENIPEIPSIIVFIDPPKIPSIIIFVDPPEIPSIIVFVDPPVIPSLIEFGPVPFIPTLISFGPAPFITPEITFGPAPFIPTLIVFGPAPYILPEIVFGPGPIFNNIGFGPAPTMSNISFGPGPTFENIGFGPGPSFSSISFGPGPTFDNIGFGPGPSFSNIGFSPAPTIPNIGFAPAPSFSNIQFGSAPTFDTVQFGPAPSFSPIEFGSPPSIPVNWGNAPSVTCTVNVSCGTGGGALRSSADFSSNPFEELEPVEVRMGGLGIPSEITVKMPEIPDITVVHDIPAMIRIEVPELPNFRIIAPDFNIPSEITLKSELPDYIELRTDSLPKAIEVNWNGPQSIKLEIPDKLPDIKLDASSIPSLIQVTGVPKTIELVGPSEIKLVMPDKMPEMELVYKGAPIDLKINLDISRLTGEDGTAQCVSIVPCKS